ncbi:MAG: extracellular solute-binding protein [Spirochaetia bacterium]
MKKLLVLLVLLSLASFSAFAGGEQEGGTTGEAATELPKTVEITKAYFFDGGDGSSNPELKEEYVDWMSERFGTQFKVNAFPRPEYMEKFALAMTAGDIKGLGWIFGGSYMEDYAADGASMVIQDEWLEDNPVWNSFPQELKDVYVRDGDLLAMPNGYTQSLNFCRGIRADWLENLGMEKPETIYEFYDVVAAFTEDDPDGNGQDDTVGMTSAGVWNIQDIFHSFDAHTNHVGAHCIITGPNDDYAFVDGMLKPGAKDALTWLRNAYEAGYLDQEIFTNGGSDMRDRMSSGQYGSCYYWATWGEPYGSWETHIQKVDEDARMELILGMTSDYADKNVNPAGAPSFGTAPWIIIHGTQEPEKLANAFYNVFIGDEIGHWGGRYGIYEKYWEFGPDGEIVRIAREKKDDGTCTYYPGPGITQDLEPLGLNLTEYGYDLECWTDEQRNNYNARLEIRAENLQKGIESGLFFQYGEKLKEPPSETYNDINADIQRTFEETVAAAVTGTKTVDKALQDYRDRMRAIGAQAVLEEANAAIGKPVTQQY